MRGAVDFCRTPNIRTNAPLKTLGRDDDHGLNEAGIDPDLTVTLELTTVTLHEALEMILRPLKLKYKAEDDVVKITAET